MTPLEPEQTTPWPPKFAIDVKRILELLTGDRFYSGGDAALREAVLNAVDACTRRAASSSSFAPVIRVDFDDAQRTMTIDDNGDGMDRDAVAGLFATIGASMSQIATNVESVGEFGIGVVSYFLVCDEFVVQTMRDGQPPIGLAFNRSMLDGTSPSVPLTASRTECGTTVELRIRSEESYELLVTKYSYWCRGVDGLEARRLPANVALAQGRSVSPAAEVELSAPDWAEAVHVGPPVGFQRWSTLDGQGRIDLLYRGVFVQTYELPGLWGMEGTISVHPKRLKPNLNREGFVGADFNRELGDFARVAHPLVLDAGLDSLRSALDDAEASGFSIHRVVDFWLAVPRTDAYAEVVKRWDAFFRAKRLFRRLGLAEEEEISLDAIATLPRPIYLVSDNLANEPDLVRSAVRILRGRRATVVQGVPRDTGFLGSASFLGLSTADVLLGYFANEIGEVIRVESTLAESVVGAVARVAELFRSTPKVALARLGAESAPFVRVGRELWVNIDDAAGRAVVTAVIENNSGRAGLLVAAYEHAGAHVAALAGYLQSSDAEADHLGLVARQYLRELVR